MANSIAKLAVIFTSDTSGLAKGAQQASNIVKSANSNISQSMGQSSLATSALAGAAGGAVVAAALKGARALYQFGKFGIGAAQELREARNRIVDDYEKLMGVTGQFSDHFGATKDTLSAQFAELKENIAVFFIPFERGLADAVKGLNYFLSSMLSVLKTPTFKKQEEDLKKMTLAIENANKRQKEFEERTKANDEAAKRAMEAMQSRAESLSSSLRTPAEVFSDTVSELKNLATLGLVSFETYTRGIAKAKEELLATSKATKELNSIRAQQRAGAVERFTTAGFSAVNSGQAELQRLADVAKAQLEVEKAQKAALDEANRIAREKSNAKPVKIGGFAR